MSRPIRFRAWDRENEKWFEPTYKGYEGKIEELLLSPTGRLGMRKYKSFEDESCFEGRFILSCSTGLLDKNGREIYEGDVVKIVPDEAKKWANNPLKEFPYGGVAKVYYDDVNAGYWLDNGDDETSMGYYAGWSGWNWLEVIGNIYEHPTLIGL